MTSASTRYRCRRQVCGVLWRRRITAVYRWQSDNCKHVSRIRSDGRIFSYWWTQSQLPATVRYVTVTTIWLLYLSHGFHFFLKTSKSRGILNGQNKCQGKRKKSGNFSVWKIYVVGENLSQHNLYNVLVIGHFDIIT